MTVEIPKTKTKETQALENAMSGKVHDIPAPPEHWVELSGFEYALDLNHAQSVLMFVNEVKKRTEAGQMVKVRKLEASK